MFQRVKRATSLGASTLILACSLAIVEAAVAPVPASAAAYTDRLYSNETLSAGQYIWSSAAYVIMQADGNLVEYDWTNTVVWASGTSGHAGAYAAMQSDGNFVIYTPAGQPLWATHTNGQYGALIAIQLDGNLVVYNGAAAVWASYKYVYNRFAAVAYEDAYCGESPCGPHNTNYTYFSNSNDCTNFVSQALRAGYKPQIGKPTSSATDDHFWWDYTAQEYLVWFPHPRLSQSASISFRLFAFLASWSGYGDYVSAYFLGPAPAPAPSSPAGTFFGDVIFYDWQSDGSIDHSNMIVGVGNSSYNGWYGSYVDSHTSNRYHVQWTLTEVNPEWRTTTAHAVHIKN